MRRGLMIKPMSSLKSTRQMEEQSRISCQKQNSMTSNKNYNTKTSLSNTNQKQQKPEIILYNGGTMRFHFLALGPYVEPSQSKVDPPPTPDPTLLWKVKLPIGSKIRKRVLVFRQIQYVISNWSGDKFPSVLYLNVDGVQGFFNYTGVATSRLAALQLQDINPILDDASMRTYDLKYVVKESLAWQLPLQLAELSIRVSIDDVVAPAQLPLANPLSVSLQIRTE